MGQCNGDYLQKLILVGGDGLTYEKLVQLQKYMQFHGDEFQSLARLVPLLELWHLEWTDLSRIYETHWGNYLSADDPGTLRNSTAEIGRKEPAKLNKFDYYPYMRLAYLVLGLTVGGGSIHLSEIIMTDVLARIDFDANNLFAHFRAVATSGKLLTLEELELRAKSLNRRYSSP